MVPLSCRWLARGCAARGNGRVTTAPKSKPCVVGHSCSSASHHPTHCIAGGIHALCAIVATHTPSEQRATAIKLVADVIDAASRASQAGDDAPRHTILVVLGSQAAGAVESLQGLLDGAEASVSLPRAVAKVCVGGWG